MVALYELTKNLCELIGEETEGKALHLLDQAELASKIHGKYFRRDFHMPNELACLKKTPIQNPLSPFQLRAKEILVLRKKELDVGGEKLEI